MIALIAVAAWISALTLVACLCVAARRGDRAQLGCGAKLEGPVQLGERSRVPAGRHGETAAAAPAVAPAHAAAAPSLRHAA